MLTAVSYDGGDCRLIRAEQLDELIAMAEIRQFLRLEGWVTVGCSPIRARQNGCLSPERRRQGVSLPDNDLLNLELEM